MPFLLVLTKVLFALYFSLLTYVRMYVYVYVVALLVTSFVRIASFRILFCSTHSAGVASATETN